MAKGIDLEHNRFLILQGEVEQISLMKPKAPAPGEDAPEWVHALEKGLGAESSLQYGPLLHLWGLLLDHEAVYYPFRAPLVPWRARRRRTAGRRRSNAIHLFF